MSEPDTGGPDRPDLPEPIGPGTPGAAPGPEGLGGPVGLGALGGLGAMGGLGGLLESAQEAISAQAQAADEVVEGSAGGGVVKAEMSGAGEVRSVTIAPEVVDPDDVEMLQDLVVAALHDAATKVAELQRRALGAFGGLDLGGLGGLAGLGDVGGPGGAGDAGDPGGPGREGPGGPGPDRHTGPGRE